MSDYVNKLIKGYELKSVLAEGGFGAVYTAYQALVKREVVIKMILPELASRPDFVRSFETEAQLVAQLEHLHIVPLYDYWRDPSGAFLVMRYMRGGSLKEALAEGPWSNEQVLRLVQQIASALSIAHQSGIIHRDLKPANILLDNENNAYLSDFGIAKKQDSGDSARDIAALVGTPAYITPEQIQSREVSPQTDIYSFALIVYEALTGHQAFEASNTSEYIIAQMSQPIPPLNTYRSDLPKAVDEVLSVATAKNPQDRFSDVLSFSTAFQRALLETPKQSVIVDEVGLDEFEDLIVFEDAVTPFAISDELLDLETIDHNLVNPYKGLRAFQQSDAKDFFGRNALIEQLLGKLQETEGTYRFLAVVGPSGSGKSSVIKAGVLPAIRRGDLPNSEHYFITEMLPSTDALRELEGALLAVAINPTENIGEKLRASYTGLHQVIQEIMPPEGEVMLLIDQFEEVFTQTEDNAVRVHFLESLRHALTVEDSRLRAIITIRADFYDKPLLYPEFGAIVRERTEVVLPLNKEELREAITGPATRVGVRVEPELVDTIIGEVSEQPGTLPLLQYALTENFERRTGLTMTLESYLASGGVLGSLARRAEELYIEMDEEQQAAIRQLFLRLVTLGEGTEDTRRRILWSELAFTRDYDDPLQKVLDRFGKYRLLTFDTDPQTREPTVEVAHEALIRQWKRLRDWLANSREDLRTHRRVTSSTAEWRNSGHEDSFLATGTRLQQFETLLYQDSITLTNDEISYIEASVARREAERLAEEARRERELALERRNRRIFQALMVVFFVAMVVGLGLAKVASDERATAQRERDNARIAEANARRRADETLSLNLAQSAQSVSANRLGENPFTALAYAVEANLITDPPAEAQQTLPRTVWQPGAVRRYTGSSVQAWGMVLSPDNSLMAAGYADGAVVLWDVATGTEVRRLGADGTGHQDRVYSLAFSPDGGQLVTGGEETYLIVWDVATGEEIRRINENQVGHTSAIWSVVYANPEQILVGANDNTVVLWDVASGEVVQRFSGHGGAVISVDVSPAGDKAISGGFDGQVIVWDVASGEALHTLTVGPPILGVAFGPDGSQFISGDAAQRVILWDTETGEQVLQSEAVGDVIRGVDFDPTGKTALAGLIGAGDLVMIDLGTGAILERFQGHSNWIVTVAYSSDGQQALTSSWDTTLILWDLYAPQPRIANLVDNGSPMNGGALSPDGTLALAGTEDGHLTLWSVETGAILRQLASSGPMIHSVAFSPDASRAVSGDHDGAVVVWDVATGEEIFRTAGHNAPVRAVAFSPDGSLIVSGGGNVQIAGGREIDNDVVVWSAVDGAEVRRLTGHVAPVRTVAFSPDGNIIASGSDDTTIILWEATTGEQVRQLKGHQDTVWSLSFSPDGQQLLSGSHDQTIRWWSVDDGRIISTLRGHTAPVRTVAFSPNGEIALSGGGYVALGEGRRPDNRILLWNLATESFFAEYTGHSALISDLHLSANGQTLLSTSWDGSLGLWQVQTLSEFIDAVYNRYDIFCTPDSGFADDPRCRVDTLAAQTDDTIQTVTRTSVPVQSPLSSEVVCTIPNPNPLDSTAVDTHDFAKTGPYRIGYSTWSVSDPTSRYITAWANYSASQSEAIEEFIVVSANDDPAQQVADIQALIDQEVDLLMINPTEVSSQRPALQQVINTAMSAGIPVVLVNHRVTANTNYVSFVGVDDFKVGCAMAQELVASLDAEGNVLSLNGIDTSLSDDARKAGAAAVFAQYPNITDAGSIATELNPDQAASNAMTVAGAAQIDAIWAYNGEMALAGLNALLAADIVPASVAGDHYSGLSMALVNEGIDGAQVVIPSNMGAEAVNIALMILQGEAVPAFVEIPIAVIPNDNLGDFDLEGAPLLEDVSEVPTEFVPEASAEPQTQIFGKVE